MSDSVPVLNDYCEIVKEGNKYKISPSIKIGLYGLAFDKAEALAISAALNRAYKSGAEDVRSAMRDILNVSRRED